MHANSTVYSDMDLDLETLPPSQPHLDVDLAVLQADTDGMVLPSYHFLLKSPEFVSGYVKTYLILPPTIYGIATGPLADLGLQHAHAHRIPSLVNIAIERGQGGLIGLGKNIWSQVHISDRTFPFHPILIPCLILIFAFIFNHIQFCP